MRKILSRGGEVDFGTTDFYYDGWRVMEERMPDSEPGTDVLMRQYTYGNYLDEVWTVDRRFCDGPPVRVADLNDGACDPDLPDRLFCHANTLYSVCGLTDEPGALREAYQYGPYGAPTRIADGPDGDLEVNFGADDVRAPAAPSSFENPFLFTGQRLDPETGLLFYKNRYYSPPLGRFLSRDPIGMWGDEATWGNGYQYAHHSPMGLLNPFGKNLKRSYIKEKTRRPAILLK